MPWVLRMLKRKKTWKRELGHDIFRDTQYISQVDVCIPVLWIRKLMDVLLQGERENARKRTSCSLNMWESQIGTKANAAKGSRGH